VDAWQILPGSAPAASGQAGCTSPTCSPSCAAAWTTRSSAA